VLFKNVVPSVANAPSDGTMPTTRIKVIWDRLLAEGEIDRAFDYHRWKVIRDLIEANDGLEMDDRHYYTGFVNHQGHEINGMAAKWKLADWLVEKLDEIAEGGYLTQPEPQNPSLLNQVIESNQAELRHSSLLLGGGGASLYPMALLGSLLVVRSCGYRLVREAKA
jgi:hypothetical protein